jgi:hypothetical protein
MTADQESGTTWRDDLTALILRKQEENKLLRKVQQSFQPEGAPVDNATVPESNTDEIEISPDADEVAFYSEEDQSFMNENNQQ